MEDKAEEEVEEVVVVLFVVIVVVEMVVGTLVDDFFIISRDPNNKVASEDGKATNELPPIGIQSKNEYVAFWDGIGSNKLVAMDDDVSSRDMS